MGLGFSDITRLPNLRTPGGCGASVQAWGVPTPALDARTFLGLSWSSSPLRSDHLAKTSSVFLGRLCGVWVAVHSCCALLCLAVRS